MSKADTDLHHQLKEMAASPLQRAVLLAYEDELAALVARREALMELYGRLHELIEWFQNGNITAERYSERHEELTEQISALTTEATQGGEGVTDGK